MGWARGVIGLLGSIWRTLSVLTYFLLSPLSKSGRRTRPEQRQFVTETCGGSFPSILRSALVCAWKGNLERSLLTEKEGLVVGKAMPRDLAVVALADVTESDDDAKEKNTKSCSRFSYTPNR